MMDLRETRLGDLLEAVAERTPAPGGGAVAAAVGALSTALGRMVVAYSTGKPDLAGHAELHARAAGALSRAGALLLALADEDARAYAELSRLRRLPEDNPERVARYGDAAAAALGSPLATLAACTDVLRLLAELAPASNRHLRSDLAIAGVLAEAGARASWWNVKVNLSLARDAGERARLEGEAGVALAGARARLESLLAACG